MKLLFFGSPDFAVPSLRALHAAGHDALRVVTRPDKPRGRGREPAATAVARVAEELGLDTCKPKSANNAEPVRELSATGAELGVVVAYGEILSPELLEATERGFLNVHASLLPDYRGAAPINWAVMRGEQVTGVSVIRMEPELDAGPLLARREVGIGPQETAGELYDRLAQVGAELITDVVGRIERGEPVPEEPQPAEGGFFARKLTKADGRVDWSRSAAEVCNHVRGVTPWPGARCSLEHDGQRTEVTLLSVEPPGLEGPQEPPGTILRAGEKAGLVVSTGGGGVRILELKPAGSRRMSARDFIHGHAVEPGDRFVGRGR
ncbi:MAG: methionyl-tRNA formyltransferase [Candidatus Brocadiia bacterium]